MKKIILTAILVLFAVNLYSQNTYKTGFAPELSMNVKFGAKFSLNTKIESFFYDEFDGTDFQFVLSYRNSPFSSFAAGYQYSLKHNKPDNHRVIQQLSLLQRLGSINLNHRFRTDQTFYNDDPFKFRVRYRLSSEVPFSGRTLDPNELYLILSDEVIYGSQDSTNEFENRVVSAVGYYFANKSKFQLGFDYRLNFKNDKTDNRLIFKVAYFISL